MQSINIFEGVSSIDNSVFKDCISLTSVTLPKSVQLIRKCAFQGCKSLTSVVLPENLLCIEEDAFSDCTALTSITVKALKPPKLDSNAFNQTGLKEVYVPAKCKATYMQDLNWSKFNIK